jgi:4'-phosphopantetheinyl transferase
MKVDWVDGTVTLDRVAAPIRELAEPGSCHVWWARPGELAPELGGLLDAEERRRLAGFRRMADRDRFVTGRLLTRLVLAAYLDRPPAEVAVDRTCPACGRPHGKPRLAAGPPHLLEFSVAHAGERVVVAVAPATAVGVDLEAVEEAARLPVAELAAGALAAEEAARLGDLDEPARLRGLLTYWTRKEAALKATGRGLAVDPRRLRVSEPGEPARLLAWPAGDPGPDPTLRPLDLGPGYVASLAVARRCDRVVIRGFGTPRELRREGFTGPVRGYHRGTDPTSGAGRGQAWVNARSPKESDDGRPRGPDRSHRDGMPGPRRR